MELGFVLSALRRRWWIVVVATVVCGVLAATLSGGSIERFQSQAVLLLIPNTEGGQVQSYGDSSRYVQGQIAAMESETFQNRVATRAGGGITGDDVGDAVVLTNEPNTDIVTVDAFTQDPDRSQAIAQAFAAQYLDDLTRSTERSLDATLVEIQSDLDDLGREVREANAALALASRPFINDLVGGATIDPAIIDAEAATRRQLAQAQFEELLQTQNDLKRGDEVQVNSAIIQEASRSTNPLVESTLVQVLAGVLGGFGLGCLIALMWNRFSAKVADEAMVSEILELPIAGTVPSARRLAKLPISALTDPPEPMRGQIQRIAVAAEARGPVDRPTRVVVVGAQRGAGTTTLAMLVAHEFISADATVALVDADPKSSRLTEIVGPTDASFDDLVDVDLDHLTSEAVLIGPSGPAGRLRRGEIEPFFDTLGKSSRIVVVDGGSVLSAATTVDLCYAADAVVLAVSTSRQNIAALRAVRRAVTRDDVMVVTTNPRGRASRGSEALPKRRTDLARATTAVPGRIADRDATEVDDDVTDESVDDGLSPTAKTTPSASRRAVGASTRPGK